jgi:hypothetical protein
MDFRWPERRHDLVRESEAVLLAAALTATAAASLFASLTHLARASRDSAPVATVASRERVMYLVPPTPIRAATQPILREPMTRAQEPRATHPPQAAGLPQVSSGYSSDARSSPLTNVDTQRVRSTRPSLDAPMPLLGPVAQRSAFSLEKNLNRAGRDSLLQRSLTQGPDLRGFRIVSKTERVGVEDEIQKRMAVVREYEPADVAGRTGMINIPLPLFASGPSRKQRVRDSIVHAANMERLNRLADRARARRDSQP